MITYDIRIGVNAPCELICIHRLHSGDQTTVLMEGTYNSCNLILQHIKEPRLKLEELRMAVRKTQRELEKFL